jgi:hypothetical protein
MAMQLPEARSQAPAPPGRRGRTAAAARLVITVALVYFAAAYLLMPAAWKRYVNRHPRLQDIPNVARTGSGIPGDPINVSLIGTKEQILQIMNAAGWRLADPLSLRSSLQIAEATVLRRSYDDAPVSNLYLWGRKEDLAFEKPVGRDPRKRHHVRFWRSDTDDPDGRPIWVGAAIFDDRVGLSRTTGQITHHTAADIDAERNTLFADLKGTGDLQEEYVVPGFRQVCKGRNGGGDPWYTDGDLDVGVIKASLH